MNIIKHRPTVNFAIYVTFFGVLIEIVEATIRNQRRRTCCNYTAGDVPLCFTRSPQPTQHNILGFSKLTNILSLIQQDNINISALSKLRLLQTPKPQRLTIQKLNAVVASLIRRDN